MDNKLKLYHFMEIVQEFFCNEDPYCFGMDINGKASNYVKNQLYSMGIYMGDSMINEQVIFYESLNNNEIARASFPVEDENIIVKITEYGKDFFETAQSIFKI